MKTYTTFFSLVFRNLPTFSLPFFERVNKKIWRFEGKLSLEISKLIFVLQGYYVIDLCDLNKLYQDMEKKELQEQLHNLPEEYNIPSVDFMFSIFWDGMDGLTVVLYSLLY